MPNEVVDWTVDKALSAIRTINAQAEHAQNTLRAARADYLTTLRSLPQIQNVPAREAIRARLGVWIRGQVGAENRYNEFATNYAAAKARLKQFLVSVDVTPPPYLGAVPLVPLAIAGGIVVLLSVVAVVVAEAIKMSQALEPIRNVTALALKENWSPEQLAAALRAADEALDKAKPPPSDPFGAAHLLEAALPVIVIVAAIYFLGPMLKRAQ